MQQHYILAGENNIYVETTYHVMHETQDEVPNLVDLVNIHMTGAVRNESLNKRWEHFNKGDILKMSKVSNQKTLSHIKNVTHSFLLTIISLDDLLALGELG
ncbi:hypothetical protein ACJX0J_029636, partial [Zea mays]